MSTSEGSQRPRHETVARPCEHEGIGRALRNAYLPRASDMPRDMADLLKLLD